jgi:hypothetical protein
MKMPHMSGKNPYKIIICVILQIQVLLAGAQKNIEKNFSAADYEALKYIRDINPLLPQFIEQKKWNELNNYMQNWKNSEAPSDELIFCISTLAAIEQQKFSFITMPCDFLYFLDDYAREMKNIKTQPAKFKYYINLRENIYYNASPECTKLLNITRSWANRLLSSGKLNASETFLCLIFSGQTEHPRSEFYTLRKSMPELDAFQHQLDTYQVNRLKSIRDHRAGTFSLTMGTWMPTGYLGTLGIHPTAGYAFGIRKKRNEYDLVGIGRFVNTTAQNYSILRNDTVYTRSYFGGGYIGFEFTRYLVHTIKCDFGPTIGVGYDEFDIASDSDVKLTSLSPSEIITLNLNTGLRFKYFFHKALFVGLALKYNFIHYENKGGTELRGNAFSIDVSYGIF